LFFWIPDQVRHDGELWTVKLIGALSFRLWNVEFLIICK
jgi:hypothetical protein